MTPALNTVACCDALDFCRRLPEASVDNIPSFCYNLSRITVRRWDMNEKTICRLYNKEHWTLRRIAEKYGTNHHMIRRILVKHGIEITTKGRKRPPFTLEHRRKLSESGKKRKSWITGRKMSEAYRRSDMQRKLKTQIDLSQYTDYERLLFLTRIMSKRRMYLGTDDVSRKAFLDKFYSNRQFNVIYDAWIASGQNRWYRPTLDHKTSQANGGAWGLDNLQFLTWFENRAKADMNEDEWLQFCRDTNTTSDLFIRINDA